MGIMPTDFKEFPTRRRVWYNEPGLLQRKRENDGQRSVNLKLFSGSNLAFDPLLRAAVVETSSPGAAAPGLLF